MKIQNKKLAQMISKANLPELDFRLDISEGTEGLSEVAYVLQEAEWIVEDFESDGHTLNEELYEARWLLNRTKYGRVIPLNEHFRPLDGFQPNRIQQAKDTVNEYNRTKRFCERLGKRFEEFI